MYKFIKNTSTNLVFSTWFLVLSVFLLSVSTYGQCAMCRAALESEGSQVKSQAVNDGIVYLMAIPYILVGAVGYYIYCMKQSNK
jgi:hypothetical protein